MPDKKRHSRPARDADLHDVRSNRSDFQVLCEQVERFQRLAHPADVMQEMSARLQTLKLQRTESDEPSAAETELETRYDAAAADNHLVAFAAAELAKAEAKHVEATNLARRLKRFSQQVLEMPDALRGAISNAQLCDKFRNARVLAYEGQKSEAARRNGDAIFRPGDILTAGDRDSLRAGAERDKAEQRQILTRLSRRAAPAVGDPETLAAVNEQARQRAARLGERAARRLAIARSAPGENTPMLLDRETLKNLIDRAKQEGRDNHAGVWQSFTSDEGRPINYSQWAVTEELWVIYQEIFGAGVRRRRKFERFVKDFYQEFLLGFEIPSERTTNGLKKKKTPGKKRRAQRAATVSAS